jgi:hypothetical protein
MEDRPNDKSRRSVLKTASLTSLGLALPVGTVSASGEGKENGAVEVVTAKSSMSIGPDSSGLSKKEHEAYIERMGKKYGSDAVRNASLMGSGSSSDGGADQEPDRAKNLTYKNSWTEHLEAKDNDGTVIVESDNKISFYESDTKDEQDRKHFFYWYWTSGQGRDQGSFKGNLWNMWNRAREQDGNDVLQYAPDTDKTRNGETYTITIGAQYQGVGVSIEGDFTLKQDKVRPHPDHTAVGNNGEYAVQWIGDYEGAQSFVGTSETRRPVGNSRSLDWDVYLKGGKYKKTY